MASYDKARESATLAEGVRGSLAATAITQASALGIGTLIVTLAQALWLDVTGVLAATALAIGGFALLPAKKRQAKQTLRTKVDELRSKLQQGIESQFEREIDRTLSQVRERISPFTRFVRAQRGQLSNLQQRFSELDGTLDRLRNDIEG